MRDACNPEIELARVKKGILTITYLDGLAPQRLEKSRMTLRRLALALRMVIALQRPTQVALRFCSARPPLESVQLGT